jgi:hypothetical protein
LSTLDPRNIFCFGYVIVNTLHKSDNKNDDDDDDGDGDDDVVDDDNNKNNNNNNKFRSGLCQGTRGITPSS